MVVILIILEWYEATKPVSTFSGKRLINTVQRIDFSWGKKLYIECCSRERKEWNSVANSRDMAAEGSNVEC
jgi:hypothetical protein